MLTHKERKWWIVTKKLYAEDDRYTEVAQALDKDVHAMLKPLFENFIKEGYSARDVSHVIKAAIGDIELETILGW